MASGYEQRPAKRVRGEEEYHNDNAQNGQQQQLHDSNRENIALATPPHPNAAGSSGDAVPTPPKKILRGKRELSCAECRRLKLKCDRVFPCQSCCKRGCQEICPEGSLTSGKGSRFILANTEQLHDKIAQLNDRIRQLEEALEVLQASCSTSVHPLLREDLLQVKSSLEITPTTNRPAVSTDAPRYNPPPVPPHQAPYQPGHEASAGPPEPLYHTPQNSCPCNDNPPLRLSSDASSMDEMKIPPNVMALSASFPVPWKLDPSTRGIIRDLLPSEVETTRLCTQARENALWQYHLDSGSFLPKLIRHVYGAPVEDLCSRRMALLLILMTIGSAVDLERPSDPVALERYHTLSRACLCDISILDEPNFDSLRALFYMIWYFLVFDNDKRAIGSAFILIGIVVKLSQSIGLHRDSSSRTKAIHEDLESRRAFIWELANLDARLSLALNRPPSLCPVYVDCRPPTYNSNGIYLSRQEALYHEWKHTFFSTCLNPILLLTVPTRYFDYDRVLHLDMTVRNFVTPPLLDFRERDGPRQLVMQRALVASGREVALLHLHRKHCTEALNDPNLFSFQHDFAPSVIATYCNATTLIQIVETLHMREPMLSVKFLGLWFNAFSAGITLSMLVARTHSTQLAVYALNGLHVIVRLFESVGQELEFCSQALPTLLRSAARSREIYLQRRHDILTDATVLPHPFTQVHPVLQTAVSVMMETPHPPPHQIPTFHVPRFIDSHMHNSNARWAGTNPHSLPEIYRFNSLGLSRDGKLQESVEPRFSEDTYHFDSGALSDADHSYMAWF